MDRRLGRQFLTILVAATLAAALLPGVALGLPNPNYLRFHGQPGDGVSGLDLSAQPVVWVTDSDGNRITSDNSTQVTLSLAVNPRP